MINEQAARRYCKDDISKIENYEKAIADTAQVWHCHHRTEIWWNCSKKELIENECYYNRKACELIFLTNSEHIRLHMKGKLVGKNHPFYGKTGPMKGKHHSDETRKKMSNSQKGKNNPMYGKTSTEETKAKLSAARKGENNPMYGKHHSTETKMKIREAALRRKAIKSKGGIDDTIRVG